MTQLAKPAILTGRTRVIILGNPSPAPRTMSILVHPPTTREAVSDITLQVVETEGAFLALESTWQAIAGQMPSKTPMHQFSYLWSWWASFGRKCPQSRRSGRLKVLVLNEGPTTVAILPFFVSQKGSFSVLPPRLRPIGYAGRLEPYDLTEEPLIAVLPGYERRTLTLTLQWLHGGLGKQWDCFIFKWFGETIPVPQTRFKRLTRKPGPAYVSLPESWQQFRKGLSKSMRDNLPYYPRLLTRKGHCWSVETAEIGSEWEQAIGELIRLHRIRACFSNDSDRVDHLSSEGHRQFLATIHDAFQGDNRSYIGLLRVDGKVVAAQLFLEDDQTLVMSYSGFDLAWSRYSPLLVLQSEVIKAAIGRGIRRLDLLCGQAPWQARWQPERPFPINKLVVASTRPVSLAKCAAYLLARESVIWWNKSRPARWLRRKRLSQNLQTLAQTVYLASARHANWVLLSHRPRLHF